MLTTALTILAVAIAIVVAAVPSFLLFMILIVDDE